MARKQAKGDRDSPFRAGRLTPRLDKRTKEPAPDITRRVIDTAAQHGVLVGSVGIFGNVIRVAPPLVMSEAEAHESLDIMEGVLTSL